MIVSSPGLRARDTWQVPKFDVLHWEGRKASACVIIPVINEGARIAGLLERMSVTGISELADIVIVDGGSTDGSLNNDVLKRHRVAGLLIKREDGKLGAQLRCAYAFAIDQGYEVMITIDGNNKDDPAAIPAFVGAVRDGYDFVQASRFKQGGVAENTPWRRWLAIRLVHAPILSLTSGFNWTDTTQGFRAYSRRLLADPRVGVFRNSFNGYELLAYLSYRAPKLGYRCIELPTSRCYPAVGRVPTKISASGELGLLKTLFKTCVGGYNP